MMPFRNSQFLTYITPSFSGNQCSGENMAEIVTTSIKSLPLVYRGKVRDSYAVGDDKLLIVAFRPHLCI